MLSAIRRYLLTITSLYLVLEGSLIVLKILELWPREGISGWFAFVLPGVEAPMLQAIWGVTAIVLGLVLGIWAWWVHPDRQEVVLATRHGDLEISKRAIRSLIQALTEQVEGVRGVTSTVGGEESDRGLTIQANLTVDPDYSMTDVVERFQIAVRTRLEEVFGINQLDKLTVRIDNVADEVVKSIPFDISVLPGTSDSEDVEESIESEAEAGGSDEPGDSTEVSDNEINY